MKAGLFSYAGRAPRVIATQVIALYDPGTGRIHHCHTVHIHKGGREVSEKEAIEAAHRHARRMVTRPSTSRSRCRPIPRTAILRM